MEATPDPLLGDTGGAEITFGEDDHQQQQQAQPQQQPHQHHQQQSQQQHDFNFNRIQVNVAGMNDENSPPLSLDGDNLNNTGIPIHDSPKSNSSDEFGTLILNSSDEDLLASIENAAYNPLEPLPIQQEQQQQPMYMQRTVDGANLLLGFFGDNNSNFDNDHTNFEAQQQQDDSLDAPTEDWDTRADQLHDFEHRQQEQDESTEDDDDDDESVEEEEFDEDLPDIEDL